MVHHQYRKRENILTNQTYDRIIISDRLTVNIKQAHY